ncbi:MAG: hypothetical protein HY904_26255 [Deltaproteobacteria bacterium]|nr:hypothetical protein [Deltaproteobacteria bacterium]
MAVASGRGDMKRHLLTASLFLVLLCLSCVSQGALQQTDFETDCSTGGCTSRPLDAPLALGAWLDIAVTVELDNTSTPPPTSLRAADSAVLGVSGARITGAGGGLSALLVETPDGVVVDFFHIWVGPATRLKLVPTRPDGTALPSLEQVLVLAAGEQAVVERIPYANSQLLLGRSDAVVTVDSPAVDAVNDPNANRVLLTAAAPGDATVTVEALGVTTSFQVRVTP